jgi:hypothetical protein
MTCFGADASSGLAAPLLLQNRYLRNGETEPNSGAPLALLIFLCKLVPIEHGKAQPHETSLRADSAVGGCGRVVCDRQYARCQEARG